MIIKKINLILILLISISFSNLYSSVWPELNLGIGINYIDTKFGGYNPDNISLSNYSGVNFSIPLQLGVGFNTPTIIRVPFEKLMREYDNINMVKLQTESQNWKLA